MSETRPPGIRFQVEPSEPKEVLPRMDIAAFVGFAAWGDFDKPKEIEDMAQFRKHFGDDLPLGRDPVTGQMQYAFLAPTVEAFFKNGGKRCWVVRVGLNSEPETGKRKIIDHAVFLDPDLADVGTRALMAEANQKHYIREEPLEGIYSLLPLEEATIVAVPDAVYLGYNYEEKKPGKPLAAPELHLNLTNPPTLEWDLAAENALYTLQESTDPLFEKATTRFSGSETQFRLKFPEACPRRYYYRVNTSIGDRVSPWSNTLEVILPIVDFKDCIQLKPAVPHLEIKRSGSWPGAPYELEWTLIEGAEGYILQESENPLFDSPAVLYEGSQTSYLVENRDRGTYYYRVRALGLPSAPWSVTCILDNQVSSWWLSKSSREDTDEKLSIFQQALLRFCAARGDLFAVLNLPYHYTYKDTSDYLEKKLKGDTSDKNEFSFGALYYPWVRMSVESDGGAGPMRYIPSDGAICGTIAARTLSQGAWTAPANEPLQGVTDLEPRLPREGWQKLYENQVNVIQQDPRGFMVLSAQTLNPDTGLQPINVRRLLILLRRLALREGNTYVFQPNTSDFHRRVHRHFEHLLTGMYTLGAFAGDSPAASFQVVTDASVNPPAHLEQGRFVVELRVAPSRPMAFITVRLVQSYDEGLSILEI